MASQSPTVSDVVGTTLAEFVAGIVGVLPKLLAGLLFLALAYVCISILRRILRTTLNRVYRDGQGLVVDLVLTVVSLFLWFGVALALLKIVGMDDVAASLGTATGFVALGVSYALSDMIEDTVAGVYLLRDPDFNPGDVVTTGSTTGTVTAIELRKSRIEVENGDTVVLANSAVEKQWTKRTGEAATPDATPPGDDAKSASGA